jgi:DNA polymerase-3 subunit gamma/tau
LSYQVLARKWRPKYFRDVKGQEHITRTLVNSIKNEKIAHAYLLTGTRGIGKTTIARIFAKAIKCENLSTDGEPCYECVSCDEILRGNSLNYIEIDGASNNSVDDIRELIETVQYLPTRGKYKVYVIDEVHMLSVSAFNALLKTLEEPPEHVVFIFATTDPQKLIGTVLSRCQRFDFKNSTIADAQNLIATIAKSEGIQFETNFIVEELAKQGKGSFRDSLSLFDQVLSLSDSNTITEESLRLSLGIANSTTINSLIEAVFAKDKLAVNSIFRNVMNENIDLKIFLLQVLDRIYSVFSNTDQAGNYINEYELSSETLEKTSILEVMWIYETLAKDLEWALNSISPENTSEFCFLKVTMREDIIGKNTQQIITKSPEKKKVIESETIADKVLVSKAPVIIKEELMEEVKIEPKETIAKEKTLETVPEKPDEEKSWEGFIKFLYKTARGLAVNIERGNLINKEDFNEAGAFLRVGFTDECKIFLDFLNDFDRKHELINSLAEYTELSKEDINISFEVIDDETKEKDNFISSVDIEEGQLEEVREDKRQNILNNKFVRSAEDIFASKIEKVVLNEEK